MEANCLNLLYPEGTASYKAVYWHVKHASLMRVWPAALAEQTVTRRRKECAAVLQFSCIRLLRNTFLEKKTFIFPTALLWRCCAVFWLWLGASQSSTWTYWPGSFPWSSVWILFFSVVALQTKMIQFSPATSCFTRRSSWTPAVRILSPVYFSPGASVHVLVWWMFRGLTGCFYLEHWPDVMPYVSLISCPARSTCASIKNRAGCIFSRAQRRAALLTIVESQ